MRSRSDCLDEMAVLVDAPGVEVACSLKTRAAASQEVLGFIAAGGVGGGGNSSGGGGAGAAAAAVAPAAAALHKCAICNQYGYRSDNKKFHPTLQIN